MALTDLTRISTSGIATGTSLSGAILHGDAHFRGTQVGVTSALFDSSDNALEFSDNVKIKLGNSGDLELYHDGNDNTNYIRSNNGDLVFRDDTIKLKAFSTQDTYLTATNGGSVSLRHDNSIKFETAETGAVVTGILTATSFSGPIGNPSGISTFYDLKVTNNLTVEGTTTTLDTNLVGVDRVEVGANSNSVVGVAVTQSGTADIVNLFDGTTEVLTVTDGGKVGIGTISPTDVLDVYSDTDPTIRSRSGSSSVGANVEICGGASHDSQLVLSSGTTAKYSVFRDGSQSDDLRIFDTTNSLDIMRYRHGGYLHFGVNGEERLRIKSDGYVGIGTDNPVNKFHVKGLNTVARFESTGSYVDLKLKNSSSQLGFIQYAGTELRFFANSGTTPTIYIPNTKFGVNTVPSTTVHIKDASADTELKIESESGNDARLLLDTSNGGGAGAHIDFQIDGTAKGGIHYVTNGSASDQHDMIFRTHTYAEKVRITKDGDVGIGTVTPTNSSGYSTLSIKGSTGGQIELSGDSVKNFIWGNTSALNVAAGYIGGSGYELKVYTDGGSTSTERVRIGDGYVSILDDTNAYYKPALNIKNTYHGGYGGAIIFTGEMTNGTEYTQARIRTFGGSGTNDGALAIEAGDLNEVARFKSGYMSIGGLVPNISGDKGLEISNAATTELRLKNTNGGTGQADGFAIQKWSNGQSYIYEYDPNNLVIGVSNSSKMKLYKEGRLSLSPSGSPDAGNSGYALSIVQAGNYAYSGSLTGNYAGIHIRSTSTGGGNGVGLFTPDQNWGLYTQAGNKTGFAIAPNTSAASSANTKLFVREDGHTSLGSRAYEELSDSIKCKVMLSVTGGGLALSGYNLQNATGEDPRVIKNWYSVAESTGDTYHHLVTSLWGGGNPPGNTSHIMGGFTIKGYSYGATQSGISNPTGISNEDIYFHNWSGSMHGYRRHYHGSGFDPGNAAYVNSSGYVTLRLKAGRYVCYYIDLYQFQVYAVRDIYVTSHTMNSNTTI